MAFKLAGLADVLRSAGLTVVETPGWKTRGYAGQDLIEIRGVLHHHTATHRSRFNEADAPTLSMCVNGRSDLAGPLCNIVFGRNGTVYLVAAGVANHAGAGSAHNIPANMGNHYLIGIEMESSGIAPWDWTADQLRVAPYLGAALERAYGASLQIAHYEYSSQGKIDPAGWPGGMDGLRASINAVLDGQTINHASTGSTEQDDDMSAADIQQILNGVQAIHDVTRNYVLDQSQAQHDVTRGYILDQSQKQHEATRHMAQAMHDVTRAYLADTTINVEETTRKVLAEKFAEVATDPQTIISLIPQEVAQAVLEGLGQRLAPVEVPKP